jgi:hypothetical protein
MARMILFIGIAVDVMASAITPSFAYYEGPWCLTAIVGRSAINICHFRTIEHCLTERPFYGGTAFCGQNPRWMSGPEQRARRKIPREPR